MFTAFLINLDRSTDRLAKMEAQAQRIGLKFERVPAVLGTAVPEHLRDKFYVDGQITPRLKPGEVGCYASHLLIYEAVRKRNLSHALVLEDDVVLEDDLIEVAKKVLDAAPSGWDIIKLCNNTTRTAMSVAQIGSRHLVRYVRQPYLTGGYLVSASGASKMFSPSVRTSAIDVDIRLPWRFGLEVFGVLPEPVKVDFSDRSIIIEMGGRGNWKTDKQGTYFVELRYAAKCVGWPRVLLGEVITGTTKWLPRTWQPRGRII